MRNGAVVIGLLALSLHGAAVAAEPPALAHNPFSRPSSEVTIDRHRVTDQDDGSMGSTPVLHATMVSDTTRLANVEGHILQRGDEIQGYKLIGIYEEFAVFKRGSKKIIVYVKPHLAENDG